MPNRRMQRDLREQGSPARSAPDARRQVSLLAPAMRNFIVLLVLTLSLSSHAGWINKSGEALPETESRKAAGDCGAHMVLVADDQQMFKVWGTASETVNVQTIDTVAVNGQVNAFIVFSGCKANSSGLCDVTVQFRVYQPNGKVYAGTPPMEVWQRKCPPPGKSLELSVQYLKVVIEPSDLLGTYVVSANVKDNISGALLQLSAPFSAKSKPVPASRVER